MEKPSSDAMVVAAAMLAAEHNRAMSVAGPKLAAPNYDEIGKAFSEYLTKIDRATSGR